MDNKTYEKVLNRYIQRLATEIQERIMREAQLELQIESLQKQIKEMEENGNK